MNTDFSNKNIQDKVDKSAELLSTHTQQIATLININDLIRNNINEQTNQILTLADNVKKITNIMKTQEKLII